MIQKTFFLLIIIVSFLSWTKILLFENFAQRKQKKNNKNIFTMTKKTSFWIIFIARTTLEQKYFLLEKFV